MRKFIIERILPGAAQLSVEELISISRDSSQAISKLNHPYHWIESFITSDKIFCVHIAESEDDIRKHAELAALPINTVSEVLRVIDLTMVNSDHPKK